MWIVKLGGSLHDAANLRSWLARLATGPGGARIVVPGGGPFADAVRALQAPLGFDALTAHRLAILAMQQYGLHLHGLEPRLELAETEAELQAATASIWLPWRLAGLEPGIAASWDVTSDSLACWLAVRLGAEGLLLVKSAPLPGGAVTAPALAKAGLVDAAFPAHAARLTAPVWLVGRDDPAVLALLAGEAAVPVCRILPPTRQ